MSMLGKLAAGRVGRSRHRSGVVGGGRDVLRVIGLVPLALSSLWAVGALVGHDTVTDAMDAAIGGLPRGTERRLRCER
jgi:membrane protein